MLRVTDTGPGSGETDIEAVYELILLQSGTGTLRLEDGTEVDVARRWRTEVEQALGACVFSRAVLSVGGALAVRRCRSHPRSDSYDREAMVVHRFAFVVALVAVLSGSPGHAQVFPGASWDRAAPEDQCIEGEALERAMATIEEFSGQDGISQAAVVRNGYLVWSGDEIGKNHRIWSCTKGFTSGLVFGLMVEDGIVEPEDSAPTYLPYLNEKYGGVRLSHFATMTSGYDAPGGDQSQTWWRLEDPLFEPGSEFLYWDAALNEFSYALTKALGGPLDRLLRTRVMNPIGASDWEWGSVTVSRDSTEVNGGSGNQKGGGGIHIAARELARVGHLLVNGGRWEGEQLISESWVRDRMAAAQVPATTPRAEEKPDEVGPGVYGFGTWTNGVQSDGTRLWPDAPPSTFAFAGHNNNHLFMVPEWNLVLVREGIDGSVDIEQYNAFFRILREGVSNCR